MSAQMQAGGIQDTFLGINYQFKLLELLAHKSVESGIKFKLFTELPDVGKLDDVVFEVRLKNGSVKFIFGQAKHKKDPKDFTYEMIMDSKEFRLFSYFDSLLEIQKKYKNIESILIITNNKMKTANGLLRMDSVNGHSFLYFIEDTSNSDTFKDISKRFKFPDAAQFPTENEDIFKNLKSNFVARKLVEFLLSKYNENVDFLHENRKFLFTKIFDETKMEFRDDVLNGTDSRLDVFRSTFEQSFKDIANKKNQMGLNNMISDCWDFWRYEPIEDKLKFIGSSSDANAGTDQDRFDNNLKVFMEKLVFVTDLRIEDIIERIKSDLQVKYNLEDVNVLCGMVEKKITDLITNRGKSIQPITEDEYLQIFKVFELFRDKVIVMRETERLFEDFNLEFVSTHQDILTFLNPSIQMNHSGNILHIRTQQQETNFISMQIYSQLSSVVRKDTFIIMKSSSAEADFKRGVRVFELDDQCKFLIIELDSDSKLFDDHKDCLDKILENLSKRMIVISDVNTKINFNSCQDLELSHIYPKQLNIQDQVLNQPVKLQNHETTWMKLMSRDFLLNNVLLSDLLNTKSIAGNVLVSKNYDKDLYIFRTFEYECVLNQKILKECKSSDEFVYSEQEFETKIKSDPDKNVHWLEQSSEELKWIQSSKDISTILKFIEDGNSKEIREDSFADHSARVSILVDVAGMGKSTVLNHLAQELKKNHPNIWIVKIDLNDYTNELDEVELDSLRTPGQATEFFTTKILKLNQEFEKILFKQSCETAGKVILLFDGFDEVASDSHYKDTVSQLIESLLKTLIKNIVIATRPEWAEYLEKEFNQIKHSLKPFSKEDQEVYLLNFMSKKIEDADENILQKIIKSILESMSESLNDHDYEITGVALITKLVAEFFERRISDYFKFPNPDLSAFIDGNLKNESFNLFSLYQHFFDKKLMIYFKDKSKMDATNVKNKNRIKKEKNEILKNYQKLAIQKILKTDHQKLLPLAKAEILNEEELKVLVSVGLVNNDHKFVHQTYGEFSFSEFLDEHFDDEDCSKFIVEVVLVDESYRIIRSFINFWISEKKSDKTLNIYREKLLTSRGKDKETPLHVVGREGNENIFWFLYSSLTKTERFGSEKTEIETYLMKMPKEDWKSRVFPYTAFVHYFQNCDDSLNILEQVKEDFSLNFLRRIFTMEMHDGQKLLHAICFLESHKNILKVLQFLLSVFSNDLMFLKQIFQSIDGRGQSFLHIAFIFLSNETLLNLFDELVSLKSIFDQDFINELILLKSRSAFGRVGGVFLSCYSQSFYFNNYVFIYFLNKLKLLCGHEKMKEFLLVVDNVSRTLLHSFCAYAKDFNLLQAIQWINEEFGKDFLIKLFKLKGDENQTIFHCFTSYQSKFESQFLLILKFLKNELKVDKEFLLDHILFNEDVAGENVFLNLFTKSQEHTFYLDFLQLFEPDLNLPQEELKNYLIKSKFLLFWISQINQKSNRNEILNLFMGKFGKTFLNDNSYFNEILHEISQKYSFHSRKVQNYLKLIEEQNSFDCLKTNSGKNSKNQTILFHFHRFSSGLAENLDWFETKFGNDRKFLENFLLQVDENRDSFLIYVLNRCDSRDIDYYFTEILNFLLKNFDPNFVKSFLLLENDENKNFLNIVYERGEWEPLRILNLLLKNFETDQNFFIKLINDKLNRNKEIKKWAKEKLKINSKYFREFSQSNEDTDNLKSSNLSSASNKRCIICCLL